MRPILRSLSLLVFAGLCSALFSPSVAHAAETENPKPYPACHREPTENDVSAAKGAFEAGQVSFQEADYDRAILYWEDAFRRDCTAVPLLTNLARAYELSGKKKSAVNALEAFLERRPESPERASIDKRIAALQKQIAEEKPDPVVAPPPPAGEPQAQPEEPEAAPPTASKPKWPVYLTGSGVLVAGLGVAFWVDGQSKVDYYRNEKCQQTADDPPRYECQPDEDGTAQEYQTAATNAVGERNFGAAMTVVGGGVAVAGAIVWYVLWNRDDTPPATSFTPVVTPNFGGVQFSGTF